MADLQWTKLGPDGLFETQFHFPKIRNDACQLNFIVSVKWLEPHCKNSYIQVWNRCAAGFLKNTIEKFYVLNPKQKHPLDVTGRMYPQSFIGSQIEFSIMSFSNTRLDTGLPLARINVIFSGKRFEKIVTFMTFIKVHGNIPKFYTVGPNEMETLIRQYKLEYTFKKIVITLF